MKKIFTLLFALGLFTAGFAQTGNWYSERNNSQYGGYSSHANSCDNHSGYNTYNGRSERDHGNYGYGSNDGYNRDRGNSGYRSDEVYNRPDQYRNQNEYQGRNDRRSYNTYGREQRYNTYENRRGSNNEHEGSNTLKAVGGGLIVGGIIALLAGSH